MTHQHVVKQTHKFKTSIGHVSNYIGTSYNTIHLGYKRDLKNATKMYRLYRNIAPDKKGYQENIFLIYPRKHVVGTH